jgi:hypothetical protein
VDQALAPVITIRGEINAPDPAARPISIRTSPDLIAIGDDSVTA